MTMKSVVRELFVSLSLIGLLFACALIGAAI